MRSCPSPFLIEFLYCVTPHHCIQKSYAIDVGVFLYFVESVNLLVMLGDPCTRDGKVVKEFDVYKASLTDHFQVG